MQLERGLKIVDSPGVVFDEDDFDEYRDENEGSIITSLISQLRCVPISLVPLLFGYFQPDVYSSSH